MTVETTTARVTYTGAGTTGPFSVPFYFLEDDDLTVIKTTIADGTETTLVLTTDYTVSGAADEAGGSVTLTASLSSAYKLTIIRDPDLLQSSDYPSNDKFPATTHERVVDKLTMIAQRLKDLINRSFRLSDGDVSGVSLSLSNLSASKLIAVNSAGTALEAVSAADVGLTPVSAFATTLLDDADASTARTTLGAAGLGANTFTDLQIWKASADIASAATVDLSTATGNVTRITGTTATSAFTMNAGQWHMCIADGAWPLTYHATTNKLNTGGSSYTCAAGDRVLLHKDNSGVIQATIFPTSGRPIAGSMPRSYLAGLGLSNNGTDSTNDIDIAAGACRDSTNAADMVLASALTKQLDAAWAVGTNAGGLDTGSIANDVYHVWLIKRSDTGVVDALFSASATSPTMPANYDYKRRIGAIVRASGAIRAFVQDGDLFRLKASVLDVGSTNPGTSSVTSTVTVPDGVQVDWYGNIEMDLGASSASSIYLRDSGANDEAASASAAPLASMRTVASGTNILGPVRIRANTSSQITWRVNFSDASTVVRMATLGWFDARGRND